MKEESWLVWQVNWRVSKHAWQSVMASECTFDDTKHSLRLIQGDGYAQSLQKVLLMKQIGQLLLPGMKTI